MTIKRILVPLPGSATHSGETNLAMTVAKAMGAHVEALFISQPPARLRTGVSDSGTYYVQGSVALAPQNEFIEYREKHAREAREQFALACAANSIPMLEANQEPDVLPSASWREREGSYVSVAAHRAAAFDLMIAASAAVTEWLKDIAEQSLLQSRRPVLLAPSRLETNLTDSAMIAWDESPECWHAVSAAIPFLKLARSVRVVSVDKNAANRRASQAEALAYLRCHGINATEQVIAPELRSVGDTLLATAAEHNIGLLVMGAYSHSRLREMLLGGATRDILQNASTRPVLMAH
jgi:nucleotide-binding universal stress UspA family protein